MSRLVRGFASLLVAVLAAGVLTAAPALAVQTSGSIVLVPSQQEPLNPGQQFTVAVYFRNTSTTTPQKSTDPAPPPFVATGARLTGPVSVDYACLDNCQCTKSSPSDITFQGCDLAGGQATSCAAGVAGEVLINLPAGGLTLAASDAPVLLATLKLTNNLAVALPPHFLRATTGECALLACEDLLTLTTCVDCAAEGCSAVSGVKTGGGLLACKHGCDGSNRIAFGVNQGSPFGNDGLKLTPEVRFEPLGSAPDFATTPLTIRVRQGGVGGPIVYEASAPNGIPQTGPTWTLNGVPGVDNFDIIRIFSLKTSKPGVVCQGVAFKVALTGGIGDFSVLQTLMPLITIEINFGNGAFVFTDTNNWNTTQTGGKITAQSFDFPVKSEC